MVSCDECAHFRLATPPNPLAGITHVSPKLIKLHTEWQRELANRALAEQQRLQLNTPFDFEPWAYPYCAHFSGTESEAAGQKVYVLCEQANAEHDCQMFVERAGG